MVAASTIITDTTIPAGSVEELRIWCPGGSFVGTFFNDDFKGKFSTLEERKCPAEDDNDLLKKLADLNNNGVPDGNEDANGNGEDDEDEDDDDDDCPDRDSDNDGTDDEDEDD